MLEDILIIMLCLFASLGVITFCLTLWDRLLRRKIPAKFYLVAENFTAEDTEKVIRCAERLLLHSKEGVFIDEIRIGEGADADTEVVERLAREYKNIVMMREKCALPNDD